MSLSSSHGFGKRLKAPSAYTRQTVLQFPTTEELYPGLEADYYLATFSKLKSFMVNFDLRNTLPLAMDPDIKATDTEAQIQAKIAAIQSYTPFLSLSIFVDTGGDIERRTTAILQNFGRMSFLPLLVPYLTMAEVLLMGKSDKILVQLDSNEYPLDEQDIIFLHGTYSQSRTELPKVAGIARLIFSGVYP